MTLILSNAEVGELLTMPECLEALEEAYRELAEGRGVSRQDLRKSLDRLARITDAAAEDPTVGFDKFYEQGVDLITSPQAQAAFDIGREPTKVRENYGRNQFGQRLLALGPQAGHAKGERRQGGGRILHIASQLGHVTYPGRALYGLTKAALIHLTKTMAHEPGSKPVKSTTTTGR